MANHTWLWALLPLLLATALAVPLLNVDAFNGDEPASILSAGVLDSGPQSLLEVWNYIEEHHATQTQGWSKLLFAWGRVVGWSELAIRALSLFFGLLTLAWVYRTGCDFLAPTAGHFAALLLSSSVFLIAYMIHARAFSLVALFTTLILWCYGRIILQPRPPGRGPQAGLLLGSIGLLYSHYVASLFLVSLVLFHLLFVPKTRRWWQPVLPLILAAMLAMLQLPGILRGLELATGLESIPGRALTAPTLVSYLTRFMTNGLLDPSSLLSGLLPVLLLLVLALVTLQQLRGVIKISPLRLLGWTTLTTLVVMIAINEVLKVIAATRIRYLMPLWPLTALLVGAGLWRLANKHRILVTGMLALWLVLGAWLIVATDFRYELGFFLRKENRQLFPVVRENVPASDLLAFDYTPALVQSGWFYDRKSTLKNIYRYKADPYETIRPVHAATPTCGCYTGRRTGWASQICRKSWDVCSVSGPWKNGALPSNATPCLLLRTAPPDLYAWRSTPTSS